eukprot:CAMPEP_0113545830 /NCGR_PEP_ID=MMETSP0015_2-20120614/11475_1 /TAXON_ID=2838 /ORGANISM="Odontella" /LENGTH=270 /DNA_ID=CAMNT_0000446231 /DNA_START=285 /DNA_END=1097 /DNA_ORIENTATION=+ /assembly_acc=CAM_ASM_000160
MSGSGSAENLPPRTLSRVAREVRSLLKDPPEGVKLVVDPETGTPASLAELQAEISGPTGTPYESKYFQLKLVLSADFPASPPRGYFQTKIYHPNVDMSTGAICVNTLKKDWTSVTKFAHVLSIVRCLLIVPFPESSLNDEAGKLFMDSYEEFSRRARLMADVHGRPRPFTEMVDCGNGGLDNRTGQKVKELSGDAPSRSELKRGISSATMSSSSLPVHRGGRSMSGTSMRSSGSLSRSSSVGSNGGALRNSGNSKTGGGVKNKKKSLKRL